MATWGRGAVSGSMGDSSRRGLFAEGTCLSVARMGARLGENIGVWQPEMLAEVGYELLELVAHVGVAWK